MIRLATPADAEAIQTIYAPIVRNTPISFEWDVPTLAEMRSRIEQILAADKPWLVWDAAGDVVGYVYASTFRNRIAYQWGAEVSIYIRADARGRGFGRTLYTALFAVLRLQGYQTAIAGATVPNPATERLHERLGFIEFGRFPAAGYKFDRWHDVVFWYLPLQSLPDRPRPPMPLSDVVGTTGWNHAIEKTPGF